MQNRHLTIAVALSFLASANTQAAVKPAAIFQDGMVLQQAMRVPVWGSADAGERVTVRFAGQTQTATANASGQWMVKLEPLRADAAPKEMVISAANTVTINNVLVGEVWLASGQSNMGFTTVGALNYEREAAAADDPLLREFNVEHAESLQPVKDVKGTWIVCTPQTVRRYSAVAYFFARELRQTLKVPVGIVHSSYGGTPAEAWTSREAMNAVPELRKLADSQIKDMEAAPGELAKFPAAIAAWEEKYGVKDSGNEGYNKGWAVPGTDTSDWKRVNVGFKWKQALGINGGGVFWVRKEVDLPESAAGKPFRFSFGWLEAQYHTVYFNGEEVGRMGTTPPDFFTGARDANIPGELVKAGRNVIAIRFVSPTADQGFYQAISGMGLPVVDTAGLTNEWQAKVEREFPPLPAEALASLPKLNRSRMQGTATTLFNAMIQPLIPYGIKGAIWYQGESNAGSLADAKLYRTLFPALIADWRGRWSEGRFPFYFVQLANNGGVNHNHQSESWPFLRESQVQTLQTVPDTGMAVAIDIGSAITIHPPNKQDVGKRLAAWALAKTYGKTGVAYEGPLYQNSVVEGEKIRVRFAPSSGQLMIGEKKGLEPAREVPGGKLSWFEIAGADKKFVWADAVIDGNSVVVSSPEVPHPVAVRYGWANNPQDCNLYNRAGLPASPFRTDDWP